jgi:H+/Cl- antiporter ClcA
MRTFASKFLRGFAVLWFILAFVLITTALGFELYWGGFWHGYEKFSEWFSPFNLSPGWIVHIVTFLPGILAFWGAEKIRPKLTVVSQ